MSDLKITHAGTVQTPTSQGPVNPEAPLGQAGSIFSNTAADLVPPLGTVFVAITFLEDTTLDTTNGLIAEDTTKYINTSSSPSHNLGNGAATSIEGEGGLAVVLADVFPKGVTIYGRWTEIDMATGTLIAYIG